MKLCLPEVLPRVFAVHGYRSLAGPFIFCSLYTARKLLRTSDDQATFLLAKTRTPEDEAGWTQLQEQARQLSDAAVELTIPRWARGREQWLADAKLLVDASAAASHAVSRRDVKALVDLNDALYTSCVQCHQHYRPNYGRRPATPGAAAAGPFRTTRRRP